jgi:hypothetical protein
MAHTRHGEKKATRQCWECLKRRLVCDYTLPGCKKCNKTGKECPGYDEQKPLQWVQPGRVTFRKRRRDEPPTVYTVPDGVPSDSLHGANSANDVRSAGLLESSESADSSSTTSDDSLLAASLTPPEDEVISQEYIDYYMCLSPWMLDNETWWSNIAEYQREHTIRDVAVRQAAVANQLSRALQAGGRRKIEAIVKHGAHHEAARLLQSEPDPLKKLHNLLGLMRAYDLPIYDYLSNETSEVVQSVEYCASTSPLSGQPLTVVVNARVYPQYKTSDDLAQNPAIIQFPLYALHLLPPAVHHTLVCLSLYHFCYSLPAGAHRAVMVSNRFKIFQHRGFAIQALSDMISKTKTRCSDMTIVSVVMFMSMDMQNSGSTDWRLHAHVMKRLIDMRGGLMRLLRDVPYLASTLVIYIIIATFANCSGPPLQQINITEPAERFLDEVRDMYSLIFPYVLCPPELYLDVIRISHLRQTIATSMLMGGDPDCFLAAHDLLSRVELFVPEGWAQVGEHYDEWVLLGTVHQSAIVVYCIMAMQSLAVFPNSLEMDAKRCIHGERLLTGLRRLLKCVKLRRFALWPLSVAGVEAGYRDESTRHWIECQMLELSRVIGTNSSLKAVTVLQRYWQKGVPGWDECFDRPYVFVL